MIQKKTGKPKGHPAAAPKGAVKGKPVLHKSKQNKRMAMNLYAGLLWVTILGGGLYVFSRK